MIDLNNFIVGDRRITRGEHIVMTALLSNVGDVVRHDDLLDALYGKHPDDEPISARSVLGGHIKSLRLKLQSCGYDIESRYGVGYRLIDKNAGVRCPHCGEFLNKHEAFLNHVDRKVAA